MPFVLRKISKNQDTRFALHFTDRVERALESYGPLLQLMKLSDPADLRLWLADTKYGVVLLVVFFCMSRPLALLQKLKQSWGVPAFHELRYIPEILEMFKNFKTFKTMKDLIKSNHTAFRFLLPRMKELQSYSFGGASLEHSPARFITKITGGVPIIVKDSEPSLRDVVRFVHSYSAYILKFVPKVLEHTTHSWSHLAVLTLDPVTLLEGITGCFQDGELVLDDSALSTISRSKESWKNLVGLVLNEDPRLHNILGMEYNGGSTLRYIRRQMTNCLYEKKKYGGNFFLCRWFLEVAKGTGIIAKEKFSKLRILDNDVVLELSRSNISYYNCKSYFKLTLLRKASNNEERIVLNIVPDVKVIVEDFFNPEISVDTLGSRHFLIIFMLVNARVMNIETGLETFFSSLKSQSFSGGQSWKTLEHRGAVKLHIGDKLSQLQANMKHLAKLSLKGLSKWHIRKLILPVTIHSGLRFPKGLDKFFVRQNNIYSRVLNINNEDFC